ncbi:Fumarylacetoacetate (FAA) hydrolase family protein [Aspergillus niger]|uniref:Fumarylacetoacetate (FAA) hydrolase family protein n=1 Tax=Aspergillus niger TaxID=5061 RepID=A0A505IJR4_ASPNG|nr:Fumarylacetoacetate (FAA) hydrolase family protein [Aspergillus niger]
MAPDSAFESAAMFSTDPRLFFGQGAYITLSTTEMREIDAKLGRHGLENQYHDVQATPQEHNVRSSPSTSSRTTGDDESVPSETEPEDIDDFSDDMVLHEPKAKGD